MEENLTLAMQTTTWNVTSYPVGERYPGIALYERFTPATVWFSRTMVIVWLVVGLPANALSAVVWLDRRIRNSSALYVAALSINCELFLVLHAVNAAAFFWGLSVYDSPVLCSLINVLYILPQYANQMLILAFTVDRFIAVCFPLRRVDFCRPSRAVKVSQVRVGIRQHYVLYCLKTSG